MAVGYSLLKLIIKPKSMIMNIMNVGTVEGSWLNWYYYVKINNNLVYCLYILQQRYWVHCFSNTLHSSGKYCFKGLTTGLVSYYLLLPNPLFYVLNISGHNKILLTFHMFRSCTCILSLNTYTDIDSRDMWDMHICHMCVIFLIWSNKDDNFVFHTSV